MSLDVSLKIDIPFFATGTGVFIRENGKQVELTLEQVKEKWPDADVKETFEEREYVFEANITHNLGKMAQEAGIYMPIWRPEEIGITKAKELIDPLTAGLVKLKSDPNWYKAYEPENKWGTYDDFVPWIERYLQACIDNPEAIIKVNR